MHAVGEDWEQAEQPGGGAGRRTAVIVAAGVAIAALLGLALGRSIAPSGPSIPTPGIQVEAEEVGASLRDAAPPLGSTRPIPPAPITGRLRPASVWTGTELLVWGGLSSPAAEGPGGGEPLPVLADGAAYDPVDGSWRPLAPAPLDGRVDAAAVWAGDRLIVWGGATASPSAEPAVAGAAYFPGGDRWVALPPAPVPARSSPVTAWTGAEVLIFGGWEPRPAGEPRYAWDGVALDPATGRWRRLAVPPDDVGPPAYPNVARGDWTGAELVIWGGTGGTSGLAYDPVRDTWRRLPQPPELGSPRGDVVSGNGTVFIGPLYPRLRPTGYGLVYEPGARDFGSISLGPLPIDSFRGRSSVWVGTGLVVLPHATPEGAAAAGAIWDPGDDGWRRLPVLATTSRAGYAAVWTGEELLTWGGADLSTMHNDGASWRPPERRA